MPERTVSSSTSRDDKAAADEAFARAALVEVTPASTIGALVSTVDEAEYLVSYLFETTLPGYPGWNWTVTIAHLPDAEPTVVETELVPAEGALLAPDWIPWSARMDDYRAAQEALGDESADSDEDDESDDDDDDDDDDSDDDTDDESYDFPRPVHGGDVDGVDIDELDADELDADAPESATPELAASAAEDAVDQDDQADPEPGDAGPEQPRVAPRRRRASKNQNGDQGE